MWYYDNWNWTKIDSQELNEIILKKNASQKGTAGWLYSFRPIHHCSNTF